MFLQTAVSIAYRHIDKNTKYNSQPQIRVLEAYSAFCTGMAQHLIYALGFLWHWAVQGSQHISGDLVARGTRLILEPRSGSFWNLAHFGTGTKRKLSGTAA